MFRFRIHLVHSATENFFGDPDTPSSTVWKKYVKGKEKKKKKKQEVNIVSEARGRVFKEMW